MYISVPSQSFSILRPVISSSLQGNKAFSQTKSRDADEVYQTLEKLEAKMKVICSILLLAFIFMQNHDSSEAFGFGMVGRMSIVRPATRPIKFLAAKV